MDGPVPAAAGRGGSGWLVMSTAGLAASRREAEGPGAAGEEDAASRALREIASAARHVEAVTESGSAFLLGQALMRLTDATAAVEDLVQRQLAVRLVAEMAAAGRGSLRVLR